MIFDIALAGSWRQKALIRLLAENLRAAFPGRTVFDFTDPRCRQDPDGPAEIVPRPFDPERTPETYAEHLAAVRAELLPRIKENQAVYAKTRIVILVLPSGADAAMDFAYAMAKGAKSFVVGDPVMGRTANHLWADQILPTPEALIEALRGVLAPCRSPAPCTGCPCAGCGAPRELSPGLA